MNFRFARHTNNLASLIKFYTKVLNLNVLGNFENHDDYNGIFLGKPDANWHIEFTESNIEANHIFDEDDILVFYPETIEEYQNIIGNITSKKIKTHQPKNPYWHTNGILIKDPDDYNVIISKQKIKL